MESAASEWIIDEDRQGAGFSRTMHGHRRLANGRYLCKTTTVPSVFLKIADPSADDSIRERVSIYTGISGQSFMPEPPVASRDLYLVDYDGEECWWADFGDDEESAEAYGLSLPPVNDDESHQINKDQFCEQG